MRRLLLTSGRFFRVLGCTAVFSPSRPRLRRFAKMRFRSLILTPVVRILKSLPRWRFIAPFGRIGRTEISDYPRRAKGIDAETLVYQISDYFQPTVSVMCAIKSENRKDQ